MAYKWLETRHYINLEDITREQFEQIYHTAKLYHKTAIIYGTSGNLICCEVDVTGDYTELEQKIDRIIGYDMDACRLGQPDKSLSEFIRREDLIDAIDSTEWYHKYNGKIVSGANSDMDSLYKLDDIIEAIKKLQRIW